MKAFRNLYRELLRQQKICGIVFGICGALCVCAVMLIYAFSSPTVVPTLLFNPYAYFMMIAGGMTFPLVGFSYLNKRNSADIFHSFPASRLELFLATAAASASWIVALNLLTYIASVFGYLLVGSAFSMVQVVSQFLYFTLGALCIMAGTMVGIGITGSTFSALLAGLVVNFVPRLTMSAIAVNVVQNDLLCFDQLGLLSPHINFAFGSWLGLFFNSMFSGYDASYEHMLNAWFPIGWPFFYTLLLTAALTLLAAWLFIRRKSESAGSAATSHMAQHIVRLGVASPFILAIMMTYDSLGLDVEEPFFWVIILGALAVYAVYELISVRSFKKMLKTLPLFVVMTVVLLLGGHLSVWAGDLVADRTVAVEDIKSVSFTGDNEMYPMDNEYSRAKYGRLEFDSDEIKRLAADALQNTVDDVEATFRYNGGVTLRVKFNTTKGSFTRYVRFTNADYLKLLNETCSDPQVENILTGLPTASEAISVNANCYSAYSNYTREQKETLWNMAVEEYLSLSQEQQVLYHGINGSSAYSTTLAEDYDASNYNTSYGWVKATGVEKGSKYSITLYLNKLFPKTLEQMYIYAHDSTNFELAAKLIAGAEDYEIFEWNLSCYYYDGLVVEAMSYSNVGLYEEEMTTEMAEGFKDSYVFLKDAENLTDKLDEVHDNWGSTGYLNVIGGDAAIKQIGKAFEAGEYTLPDIYGKYYSLTVYGSDENYENNLHYNVTFSLE